MTKKSRKKHTRRIALILADFHSGHRLGLMSPNVELGDYDERGTPCVFTPEQTAMQKYLWKRYEIDLDSVQQLAKDDEMVIFVNGDLHQGEKYKNRMVTTLLSNHILIGVDNVRRAIKAKNVKTVRILQGTDAHNYGSGASEVLATRLLQDMPGKDIKCVAHSLANIDGVTFDLAHHGPPPGSRYWLNGNVARYYLRSAMMTDLGLGKKPADVYVRAHYHTFIWETVRIEFDGVLYTSHIVITPSYFGLSSHGRQATRSVPIQTHGCVAFEIVNGKLAGDGVYPFKETIDLRTEETL